MTSKDVNPKPKVAAVPEPSDQTILSRHGIILNKILLGYGSYSKVKAGYDLKLKRKLAVKIIDRLKAPLDYQEKFLPRELKIWSTIKHPNIILMYDCKISDTKVFMLLELAEGGDMLTYLQKIDGPMREDECQHWMKQLCDAVGYLHERDIIHRDLKLENLLIDSTKQLKLCDFGFSKQLHTSQTTSSKGSPLHRASSTVSLNEDELSKTYCGSKAYASPEILLGEPYDPRKADIWALGCIFFIFLTGKMPFKENNCNSAILKQVYLKSSSSMAIITFPILRFLSQLFFKAEIKTDRTLNQQLSDHQLSKQSAPPNAGI